MLLKIIANISSNNSYWALILSLCLIPIISIITPKPSIDKIEFIGDFKQGEIYECFFTDNSFEYVLGNSDVCKCTVDTCKLVFTKPAKIGHPVYSYRLDFNSSYSDSSSIDSIKIHYKDNKTLSFTAKSCFKRTGFSWGIDRIDYDKNGRATIYFKDIDVSHPYIEFEPEQRSFSLIHFFVIFGSVFLLIFLIGYLKIKSDEITVFIIAFIGFLSFFSSIVVNNIFIIFLSLLGVYALIKRRKVFELSFIQIGFMTFFVIKLLWTLVPSLSQKTGFIFEKYMVLIFIPMAFSFIEMTPSIVRSSIKAIFLATLVLLYVNFFSYINYLSFPRLVNFNSSYISPLLFHSPTFNHSSYIIYFYMLGLLSALWLYRRNIIKLSILSIMFIALICFSILSSAFIGLIFLLFLFFYFVFISVKPRDLSRKIILAYGFVIFVIAIIIPFTNWISYIDPMRDRIWEIARGGIKENILFGLGSYGERLLFTPNITTSISIVIPLNNAHNQLLNNMLEHGIFVGSYIYIFQLIILIRSYKNKNSLLLMFVLITIIFMTTEVIMDRSRGLLFFVSTICFLEKLGICTENDFKLNVTLKI